VSARTKRSAAPFTDAGVAGSCAAAALVAVEELANAVSGSLREQDEMASVASATNVVRLPIN
jgi:hypothetical protein